VVCGNSEEFTGLRAAPKLKQGEFIVSILNLHITTKTKLLSRGDTRHQLPRQSLTASLIEELHAPAGASFDPAGQVTI